MDAIMRTMRKCVEVTTGTCISITRTTRKCVIGPYLLSKDGYNGVSKDGYNYENDEEVRGGDYKNMYQHYENDEEERKTGYNYKNAEEVRKVDTIDDFRK